MRLAEIVGSIVVAATLSACKADPGPPETPARIVDPTEESRAELNLIVTHALNGADVMLASDALTKSSVLIIEPKVYRDAQGNRISGRELRAPIQFVLLKQGEQCVLELRSSGERWPLPATRCVPE